MWCWWTPDRRTEATGHGSAESAPAALARRFTERDPRFRIVRGAAHGSCGPGAARNAGARHAYPDTGHLAFLDADDVLLPRAYEDLVGLLDRSGADFATGNVYRLGAAGRSQSRHHPAGRDTVLRTHITDDLTLLSDHFARNKVFRRAFWDRHGLAFPDGERCEDAAVTLPAHFLADAVDVLHEHVCYWRLPDGPGRHRAPDARSVRDRFAAVAAVRALLTDPARSRWSAHLPDFDRAVLTDELPGLIEALPAASAECRTVFLECARDFLARVDPQLFPALPVELRMRWYLVRAGRLADLLTLLAHEARNPGGFAITGPPLRKRAVLPLTPPLALPPGVTRLERADFPVRARVLEAVWRNGTLLLRGYAYIRNLDAATRHGYLRTAVVSQGRRRILLPLRPVAMPQATADSGQEQHCYDWSGFELALDPRRLRKAGRWEEGDWSVSVLLASAGVVRAAGLCAPDTGSGAEPLGHEVVPFAEAASDPGGAERRRGRWGRRAGRPGGADAARHGHRIRCVRRAGHPPVRGRAAAAVRRAPVAPAGRSPRGGGRRPGPDRHHPRPGPGRPAPDAPGNRHGGVLPGGERRGVGERGRRPVRPPAAHRPHPPRHRRRRAAHQGRRSAGDPARTHRELGGGAGPGRRRHRTPRLRTGPPTRRPPPLARPGTGRGGDPGRGSRPARPHPAAVPGPRLLARRRHPAGGGPPAGRRAAHHRAGAAARRARHRDGLPHHP